MTVTALPKPPCAENTEFETLYRAWRYAKAQWDLADNDPNRSAGLTIKEAEPFCDAEHAALLAFFACPAGTLQQFSRKLDVICKEAAWTYTAAPEIFAQVRKDARNIANNRA